MRVLSNILPSDEVPRDLRSPGAILLVSCYELGHQPLGLAFPAASLERAGFKSPHAIDLSVDKWDHNAAQRARFVGISVPMHTALRLGVRVAERVRAANPNCAIAFYGLYAVLNADHLLSHLADFVLGGESETALTELVAAIDRGASTDAIAGVRTARNRAPALSLDRVDFPTPNRAVLPSPSRYATLVQSGARRLAGAVEASRGCLHLCRHCPIPPVYGGRFFVVPESVVLDDIRQLVAAGVSHITFADPDFLNGPLHSTRIVRRMNEEFPHLTFDFTAKVEHLLKHEPLLRELRARGAIFVVSAFESLSDEVLHHLRKGHTRHDIGLLTKLLRDVGLPVRPSFVPFTPWSTLDDVSALFDFVADERLIDAVDPVQYAIRLLLPPGSLLLSEESLKPTLGPVDHKNFVIPWRHPDARIDALQATVHQIVVRAATREQDAYETFLEIREAVDRTNGRPPRRPPPERPTGGAPRLSEPWFC